MQQGVCRTEENLVACGRRQSGPHWHGGELQFARDSHGVRIVAVDDLVVGVRGRGNVVKLQRRGARNGGRETGRGPMHRLEVHRSSVVAVVAQGEGVGDIHLAVGLRDAEQGGGGLQLLREKQVGLGDRGQAATGGRRRAGARRRCEAAHERSGRLGGATVGDRGAVPHREASLARHRRKGARGLP